MRSKVVLLAVGVMAMSRVAAAGVVAPTLWYSGDPELGNWGNASSTPDNLRHWQPFTVTDAAGWTVGSVFSVGELFNGSSVEWSIRTGMGVGNPGSDVVSGVSGSVITSPMAGYLAIEVDIPDVFLAPGVYWLEVAAFAGTIKGTTGTNAIGAPPAHSLRNWPNQGQFYQEYSNPILSSGVRGVVAPAPGSLAALAMGGLALGRRRRA